MLILSRKIEECIMIGDTITIKILGIHEGQVKIGIEAPKDIKVYRSEVYEQIQKENVEASKAEKQSIAKAATLFRTEKPGESKNQ